MRTWIAITLVAGACSADRIHVSLVGFESQTQVTALHDLDEPIAIGLVGGELRPLTLQNDGIWVGLLPPTDRVRVSFRGRERLEMIPHSSLTRVEPAPGAVASVAVAPPASPTDRVSWSLRDANGTVRCGSDRAADSGAQIDVPTACMPSSGRYALLVERDLTSPPVDLDGTIFQVEAYAQDSLSLELP